MISLTQTDHISRCAWGSFSIFKQFSRQDCKVKWRSKLRKRPVRNRGGMSSEIVSTLPQPVPPQTLASPRPILRSSTPLPSTSIVPCCHRNQNQTHSIKMSLASIESKHSGKFHMISQKRQASKQPWQSGNTQIVGNMRTGRLLHTFLCYTKLLVLA